MKFEISREGDENAVVLPEGADLGEVAAQLMALKERESSGEQAVNLVYNTKMTVPNGAISFMRVMRDRFGFVNMRENPGFFGPTPPELISVEVGAGKKETVPFGNVQLPGIEGVVNIGFYWLKGNACFRVVANVKMKYRAKLDELMREVESGAASVYRGQAVRVSFPKQDEAKTMLDFFPTFVRLPRERIEPIFNPDVDGLVNAALWVPVERSADCRKVGVKLKRGVLLAGTYGTGKTLIATSTAQRCSEHGWTFVYADMAKSFASAYDFAKANQPAVIFVEDIDSTMDEDGGRNEKVDEILNTIDGVDSKDDEVISVLTTNDLKGVTRALLRPGRMDAIITIPMPSAATIERLVRRFAGAQLAESEDLAEVVRLLDGCIPAMVREVVERSKLAAIGRGELRFITAEDIATVAAGAKEHMALINDPGRKNEPPIVQAAEVIGQHVAQAIAALAKPKANGNGQTMSGPGLAKTASPE